MKVASPTPSIDVLKVKIVKGQSLRGCSRTRKRNSRPRSGLT